MSILTKFYNFIKPELTDAADITATNENWDAIDNELNDLNEAVDTAQTTADNAMPKRGGNFTGDVDFEAGKSLDFKVKDGTKLRIIGGISTNRATIRLVDANDTTIADILQIDTTTGEITSASKLMPKSGGQFDGRIWVATGNKSDASVGANTSKGEIFISNNITTGDKTLGSRNSAGTYKNLVQVDDNNNVIYAGGDFYGTVKVPMASVAGDIVRNINVKNSNNNNNVATQSVYFTRK